MSVRALRPGRALLLAVLVSTAALPLAVTARATDSAAAACEQLDLQPPHAQGSRTTVVATVPLSLSGTALPSGAVRLQSAGSTVPVAAQQLADTDLAVVVVLAPAVPLTAVLQAARELLLQLPVAASTAVVSNDGVLAPLGTDRSAALRAVATWSGRGTPLGLDRTVQLAGQQVSGSSRPNVVVLQASGPVPALAGGVVVHDVGGSDFSRQSCPEPGSSLIAGGDAVAARLRGQYLLTLPTPAVGSVSLDSRGVRTAAELPDSGSSAGSAGGALSGSARPHTTTADRQPGTGAQRADPDRRRPPSTARTTRATGSRWPMPRRQCTAPTRRRAATSSCPSRWPRSCWWRWRSPVSSTCGGAPVELR